MLLSGSKDIRGCLFLFSSGWVSFRAMICVGIAAWNCLNGSKDIHSFCSWVASQGPSRPPWLSSVWYPSWLLEHVSVLFFISWIDAYWINLFYKLSLYLWFSTQIFFDVYGNMFVLKWKLMKIHEWFSLVYPKKEEIILEKKRRIQVTSIWKPKKPK